MTPALNNGYSRLRTLISQAIEAKITIPEFCAQFEVLFNLELEKSELPNSEIAALSDLFEVVIWYSPFADEREQIPNYVDEKSVLAAAAKAAAKLQIR
jgi:hypothetical protein